MIRLKKQCKSNDVKFQGTPKTIKFDEVYSVEEFDALFSGKGALVQPTPENKPKSAVTIIHFVGLVSLLFITIVGDHHLFVSSAHASPC